MPLRPITSCVNTSTYNLSRHLVAIMSSLLHEKYSVKNSTAFAQQIKDQRISEDEVMIFFDVVSLFTFIPIDLALRVVRHRLHRDANHHEAIGIRPQQQFLYL